MTALPLTLQPRPAEPVDPSVDHAILAIVSGASTAATCAGPRRSMPTTLRRSIQSALPVNTSGSPPFSK